MLTVRLLIAGLCASAFLSVSVVEAETTASEAKSEAAAPIVNADAVRSPACQGVDRPLLAGSTEPWELTYSWGGGLGADHFDLRLSSSGKAVMTQQSNSAKHAAAKTVSIPRNTIDAISREIDDSALLCQTPVPREGYIVFDLGKFSLTVTQGSYSKNVYVDECHTMPDTQAMERVINKIVALKPLLEGAIEWGPYATSTGKGSCNAPSGK